MKRLVIILLLVSLAIVLIVLGRKSYAKYKTFLGKTVDWTGRTLTRGERNNNCGNIKFSKTRNWKGRVKIRTDTTFEQFIQFRYGTLAMIQLLSEYIQNGLTLRQIIGKYAPPSENDTSKYLNTVANKAGLGLDVHLQADTNTLKGLVLAMTFVENGRSITIQDFNQGYALI